MLKKICPISLLIFVFNRNNRFYFKLRKVPKDLSEFTKVYSRSYRSSSLGLQYFVSKFQMVFAAVQMEGVQIYAI